MNIGLIGAGNMGSAITRRLLAEKHRVRVYNRSEQKAQTLVALGAELARTPADAAAEAEFLISIVKDDAALEDVLLGPEGALLAMKPSTIHVSMSTVSAELARTLMPVHEARNVGFVGAPVFGRPPAALEGKLFVLAGGSASSIAACRALFETLAQKVLFAGDSPAAAHLQKVIGNFMLFAAIEATAEAVALARAAGLDAQVFLDAMTGSVFSAPFYEGYGQMMVEQSFGPPAAVSAQLALKDVRLALQAARNHGAALPTASLVHDHLVACIGRGDGERDVSVLSQFHAENAGLSSTQKEST